MVSPLSFGASAPEPSSSDPLALATARAQSTAELRCAPQTTNLGLDPRGTAAPSSTLILIEHRGLWPARIEDAVGISDLPPRPEGFRVLATRAADSSSMPRLTVWSTGSSGPDRGQGGLRFMGLDYEVADGQMPAAVAAIIARTAPDDVDGVTALGSAPPEVLICGHGRRDACCGSFGIRLLAEVEERAAETWPGVRVRRCSHTGGHRFAPTGITLPEGRTWASLNGEVLDAIVSGHDEHRLAQHNRGLLALDSWAQRAEAALFDHVGPAWRTYDPIMVAPLDRSTGPPDGAELGGSRTYVFSWSEGARGRRATVTIGQSGSVPVPACRAPIDQAKKSSPVFEVRSLTVE